MRLTTQQKRKLKGNQLINRRGFSANYDPYSFIIDEAEIYSHSKQAPTSNNLAFSQQFSKQVNRWYKAEYFYSWIDKPYYQLHSFQTLLEAMDLGSTKLNTLEWSIVRQTILGDKKKPRRFTENFIKEEKRQIEEYREIFREIITGMQHKTLIIDQSGQILFDPKNLMLNPKI